VEKYNQASGYLRQVLAWIGIENVEIILADRTRAGATGESAVEQFGTAVMCGHGFCRPWQLSGSN
jgi:FMN-dependent NADH-azoreductase